MCFSQKYSAEHKDTRHLFDNTSLSRAAPESEFMESLSYSPLISASRC